MEKLPKGRGEQTVPGRRRNNQGNQGKGNASHTHLQSPSGSQSSERQLESGPLKCLPGTSGETSLPLGTTHHCSANQWFAFKYANREWSADLLLECHVPCPALPLSSAVCCLSVTATRFPVYACVDLCHEREMNVQHEKTMHVDDHGALEWVTLPQMMVINVGYVWTEGPPGAEGSHWVPQQSGSTVWGPGKAVGGSWRVWEGVGGTMREGGQEGAGDS